MKGKPTPTVHPARFAILLVAACCLLTCGCGRKGPETITVRGQVTFGGGPCPGGGTAYFAPVAAADGQPLRPATADFDTNGRFAVTSFDNGDGLVPGEYAVRIVCWKQRPQGYGQPGEDAVPRDFKPDNLIIEPGTRGAVEVAYDVPAPSE